MKMKTATWNIGGAKLLKHGEDPSLMSSYSENGLKEIATWLRNEQADIVSIQEAQGDASGNQIEEIAKIIEYQYFFYDPTSGSHIDKEKSLGNGIISKHPITRHQSGLFYNPNLEFNLEGKIVVSHEKGFGACHIDLNGTDVHVFTIHLIPFSFMNIKYDSEVARIILSSVSEQLHSNDSHIIIQGDFNINDESIKKYLPQLFKNRHMKEIVLTSPTTPKGRKYDHVLYKGFTLEKIFIDSKVKTDHYPVLCNFEIEK